MHRILAWNFLCMHIATLQWGVWPFPAKPLESIDHHRNAKSQTRWPYLMADYWCLRTCFFNMSLHLQMYLYVHTWESICICIYIYIYLCVFHRFSTLKQKLPLFPGPWSWWSKWSWSRQGSFQVFLGDVFFHSFDLLLQMYLGDDLRCEF